MAELLGKVTGLLNGWFHAYFLQRAPLLWWSRNWGQIPVGAGLAFADKYFETNAVTLTYFGDGAARQGSCTKPLTWQCYGNYRFYR
jgi:pyruvate dehydrogenase E1 component alpha subunit